MRFLSYIFLIFPVLIFAQIEDDNGEDKDYDYYFIKGDTIPKVTIDLEEVKIFHKLKFDSKEDRRQYLILRRKTIKVYHYAKLAAERLEKLNERLDRMKTKRQRKRYSKKIQKFIEDEFAAELKKLTRTEGQILVKLIHRQTGRTTFDLIKELRSGWRAFWFNSTANLFNISLKREFNPIDIKEDYLIEDILQRSFQRGSLEPQESAIPFDFYELSDKWLKPKTEKLN